MLLYYIQKHVILDWSQQFIQEFKLEGRRAAKTEQIVCVDVFLYFWDTLCTVSIVSGVLFHPTVGTNHFRSHIIEFDLYLRATNELRVKGWVG